MPFIMRESISEALQEWGIDTSKGVRRVEIDMEAGTMTLTTDQLMDRNRWGQRDYKTESYYIS